MELTSRRRSASSRASCSAVCASLAPMPAIACGDVLDFPDRRASRGSRSGRRRRSRRPACSGGEAGRRASGLPPRSAAPPPTSRAASPEASATSSRRERSSEEREEIEPEARCPRAGTGRSRSAGRPIAAASASSPGRAPCRVEGTLAARRDDRELRAQTECGELSGQGSLPPRRLGPRRAVLDVGRRVGESVGAVDAAGCGLRQVAGGRRPGGRAASSASSETARATRAETWNRLIWRRRAV